MITIRGPKNELQTFLESLQSLHFEPIEIPFAEGMIGQYHGIRIDVEPDPPTVEELNLPAEVLKFIGEENSTDNDSMLKVYQCNVYK